ncbi:hypothetical protein D3C75_872490 [compost metagenome]
MTSDSSPDGDVDREALSGKRSIYVETVGLLTNSQMTRQRSAVSQQIEVRHGHFDNIAVSQIAKSVTDDSCAQFVLSVDFIQMAGVDEREQYPIHRRSADAQLFRYFMDVQTACPRVEQP